MTTFKLKNIRLRRVSLVADPANEAATVVLFKSADGMRKCSKCGTGAEKDAEVCAECGESLKEIVNPSIGATGSGSLFSSAPAKEANVRSLKVAARTPGDDIETRIEEVAKANNLTDAEAIDLFFGRVEGVGERRDEERAARSEAWEAHRRSVVVPVKKKAVTVDSLTAVTDDLAKRFGISHSEAYELVAKSDEGRALVQKAARESRSTAIEV